MKKLILLFLGCIVFMKIKKDEIKVNTPTTVFYQEKLARKFESLKIYAQIQLERVLGLLK